MQSFKTGQANIVFADLVNRSTAAPITTGTVTGYLYQTEGDNSGKWYNASGGTWDASEASAGSLTHISDGHWYVSIASGAWEAEARYSFYVKESGNLHIPYSDEIVEVHAPDEISFEATVES